MEEGSEGAQLVWTLSDKYARGGQGSYIITQDGVTIYSGTYNVSSSKQLIIFNIDDLSESLDNGSYIFKLIVDDGYSGIASNVVNFTIYEKIYYLVL